LIDCLFFVAPTANRTDGAGPGARSGGSPTNRSRRGAWTPRAARPAVAEPPRFLVRNPTPAPGARPRAGLAFAAPPQAVASPSGGPAALAGRPRAASGLPNRSRPARCWKQVGGVETALSYF